MIINVSCSNFEQSVRKIYLDKEQSVVGVTLGEGLNCTPCQGHFELV